MYNSITTLFLLVATALNAQTFVPAGISGGGAMYAPAINPHNNKLFLVCDMGDFYGSTNNGQSWDMVNSNDFEPDINSEAQFTSDPNILYSIKHDSKSGDHFPVKSTDNGSTWSLLASDPSGGNCAKLYVKPGTTNQLIIIDAESINYSSDGGGSFSQSYQASAAQFPFYIAGCFWEGNNVYLGSNHGMFTSSNSGTSFNLDNTSGIPNGKGFFDFCGSKSNGVTRLFAIVVDTSSLNDAFLNDTELTGNQEIFQCDFGSSNWVQSFAQADVNFFYLACGSSNINTVYAAADYLGAEGRVFKTTDGGTTWNNVFQTVNNQNIITGWAGEETEFGWAWSAYAHGITTKSNDPDYVLISDWGFAFLSTDGGSNWQQVYVDPSVQNNPGNLVDESLGYVNNGLMLTSCWNVSWFAQDSIFISYTDITGWRSYDSGQSWMGNDLNNDYNTTYQVIHHPTQQVSYAAVSEVHDLFTTNYLTDEDIDDGEGAVLYTTNNAVSWDTLHNFHLPVVDLVMDPNNPELMYAAVVHSQNGFIYKTTNLSAGSAAVWTALPAPNRTEGHPYLLNVLDDGALVVSYSGRLFNDEFTASSGVFYSTDGGGTWQDRSHGDMFYWTKDIVIDPHDASGNTWYACVEDGFTPNTNGKSGVFRSTDRGQTWAHILPNVNAESVTVDPNNSNRMFVTSVYSGLLMTDDLSASQPSFSAVSEYPFHHPMRVTYNPYQSDEIWVTSFGNGAYVANQSALSVAQVMPEQVLSIYPNPVSEYLHLKSEVLTGERFDLSIFDSKGRLVFHQEDRSLVGDEALDVERLGQGIYFLNLKGKTFNQTLRFIKITE